MAATLHGPELSSPGSHIPEEKTSGVRSRARLLWSQSSKCTHTSSLERFSAFPGFSPSGLTFCSPPQLTVSK